MCAPWNLCVTFFFFSFIPIACQLQSFQKDRKDWRHCPDWDDLLELEYSRLIVYYRVRVCPRWRGGSTPFTLFSTWAGSTTIDAPFFPSGLLVVPFPPLMHMLLLITKVDGPFTWRCVSRQATKMVGRSERE